MEELNKQLLELQEFKNAYLELTKKSDIKIMPPKSLIDISLEVAQNVFNNYSGQTDNDDNDDDEYSSPSKRWKKKLNKNDYREVCKKHIEKEEFWLGIRLSTLDINLLCEKIPEAKLFLDNKEFRYKYIKKNTDLIMIENVIKEKEEKKEILKEYINSDNPQLKNINFYSGTNLRDALKDVLNDETIDKSKRIKTLKDNLPLISLIDEKGNRLLNDNEVIDVLLLKNKYKDYMVNLNEENQIRVIKESNLLLSDLSVIRNLKEKSQKELIKRSFADPKFESSQIILYFLQDERFKEDVINEISKNKAIFYFRHIQNFNKENSFTAIKILENNDIFKSEKNKYLKNWIETLRITHYEDSKIIKDIKENEELKNLLYSNEIYQWNKRIWENKRNFTIENIKSIYKLINEKDFTEEEKENQIITAFNHIDVEMKKELRIKKEGIYKYISYEVLREEIEEKNGASKKIKI